MFGLRNLLQALFPIPRIIVDDGCQLISDGARARRIIRSLVVRWPTIFKAIQKGQTTSEAQGTLLAEAIVPPRCKNSDASGNLEVLITQEIRRGILDSKNPFISPSKALLEALGK